VPWILNSYVLVYNCLLLTAFYGNNAHRQRHRRLQHVALITVATVAFEMFLQLFMVPSPQVDVWPVSIDARAAAATAATTAAATYP